jgi:hypothetical protein
MSNAVSTYNKMNEYVLDLLCDDETSRYDSQDLLHLDDMVRLGETSSFKAVRVYMYECMHVCMYVWICSGHLPSTPGQPITS